MYCWLSPYYGRQHEDLCHFMRFVTGSCVCITPEIRITLNSLSGLARRPIAHTCDCSFGTANNLLQLRWLSRRVSVWHWKWIFMAHGCIVNWPANRSTCTWQCLIICDYAVAHDFLLWRKFTYPYPFWSFVITIWPQLCMHMQDCGI